MRVFVTVGTALDPFDRMLRLVDEALPREGVTGVCQYGSSTVVPRGLEGRERLSRAEFERELRESDVVICHAGVGSIHAAIEAGHRPIVMARRADCGEHVNDHQLEICRELARGDRVCWVESLPQMQDALRTERSSRVSERARSAKAPLEPLAEALSGVGARAAPRHPLALRLLARWCPSARLRYPPAGARGGSGVDAPLHKGDGPPAEPR